MLLPTSWKSSAEGIRAMTARKTEPGSVIRFNTLDR